MDIVGNVSKQIIVEIIKGKFIYQSRKKFSKFKTSITGLHCIEIMIFKFRKRSLNLCLNIK